MKSLPMQQSGAARFLRGLSSSRSPLSPVLTRSRAVPATLPSSCCCPSHNARAVRLYSAPQRPPSPPLGLCPFPRHKECWSCHTALSAADVFCRSCSKIQPVALGTSYFELLSAHTSLSCQPGDCDGASAEDSIFYPKFALDLQQLRRNFLTLQQSVHPDGFTKKSPEERKYSEVQSSLINKAYQTLREPLSRAKYMLGLYNVKVEEGEAPVNQELLMEVMEVREAIEEAEREEDLEEVRQETKAKMNETIASLDEAFGAGDLTLAKALTIELQYRVTMEKALKEWDQP
ncbi:uncharacterized protein BJ171DRAFT_514640 [Polychytrium aggregatum]|uniref:uncharacterized protein n=1 Tax=Polychytrium aggregatum TaxID=110093 RepID=UPI0022FF1CEC|nr:uncharacterized protein BJ171DRAFT_514640 [Polychytrium aggregatum]KAI9202275.1 hypothetical protein BJ171DRAFT_514640 [Polychytrium aggregatum]